MSQKEYVVNIDFEFETPASNEKEARIFAAEALQELILEDEVDEEVRVNELMPMGDN